MVRAIILILLYILIFAKQTYAQTYSFLFGIPDKVVIGNGESGIVFPGRIINNGNYPITINSGGTGNDPSCSSPSPWWNSNYWEYNIQGSLSNILPGEVRNFQLGIYRDDPLINRSYQYCQCFFVLADLDGDGNHDIGTPYQYSDSSGWIFDDMARTLVTFGDTSYISSNYYYVQSTLDPNFRPETVIPEPSTLFLLSIGLLMFIRRNRK